MLAVSVAYTAGQTSPGRGQSMLRGIVKVDKATKKLQLISNEWLGITTFGCLHRQ